LDYRSNVLKIKAIFVVHVDFREKCVQIKIRPKVIEVLHNWCCELVGISYTQGILPTQIKINGHSLKILARISALLPEENERED